MLYKISLNSSMVQVDLLNAVGFRNDAKGFFQWLGNVVLVKFKFRKREFSERLVLGNVYPYAR